jgi:hypothetical protein
MILALFMTWPNIEVKIAHGEPLENGWKKSKGRKETHS